MLLTESLASVLPFHYIIKIIITVTSPLQYYIGVLDETTVLFDILGLSLVWNHHLPRIIASVLKGRKWWTAQVFFWKTTLKPISNPSCRNVGNKMRLFVYWMWRKRCGCWDGKTFVISGLSMWRVFMRALDGTKRLRWKNNFKEDPIVSAFFYVFFLLN